MPFGLRNAPATFQRALDIILSGVRWQTCLIYLDDVIIFSKDIKSHLGHVDEILTLLGQAGITLDLKKCKFFQPRVDYPGHVITPGKLAVALDNTKAFANCTFPRNVTQMPSFLGVANMYRRFIKNFSGISKPLDIMLKKYGKPNSHEPTQEARDTFEFLKKQLVAPPVPPLPKLGCPYMIDTDASAYQLGATLLQQHYPSKPNEWRPIGYWSKTLNSAEQNYSATERECYSVVWAVTTLRPYLEGQQKFTMGSDHDALRWLLTLTDPSGRLMRWRLRLSEFDFEIHYRSGRVHQVPDALSRLISPSTDNKPVGDEIPTFGDHQGPVPVTFRSRNTGPAGQSRDQDVPHTLTHEEDDALDDTLDEALDLFDLDLADAPHEPLEVNIADVPTKLTIPQILLLESQRTDAFCQTVLLRQALKLDKQFYEDDDGLLRLQHPRQSDIKQIVIPESLRPRILKYSGSRTIQDSRDILVKQECTSMSVAHIIGLTWQPIYMRPCATVLLVQRTGSSYASARIFSSYFQLPSRRRRSASIFLDRCRGPRKRIPFCWSSRTGLQSSPK